LANEETRVAAGILGFDIWSGWGDCATPIGLTNTVIFWVDNIWFEWNTNTAPVPPPIVDLTKAGTSGVQITLDTPNSQWQRDAIATPASPGNCFWNDDTTVTYSFTIADFPKATAHPDFEAHLFIVNGDTDPGGAFDETYGGCDWNAADIAVLSLVNQTNGNVHASFYWKTNLPNANPLTNAIYHPVTITNLIAIGTWNLSFNYGTNVTLSGPGGALTNFTIPEEAVVNRFSPTVSYLQFGFHKNDDENDGHNDNVSGTFSRIKKVGGGYQFDDAFDGDSYTNHYAWRKTSATAVQFVKPGTAWWLNWTVPATGFYPQKAPLVSGAYSDISGTPFQSGAKLHIPIPAGGDQSYFRLLKRPYTKLLVLLPGETAAPNTISGKSGTPDAQNAGVPFNITVNACDDVWNKVATGDTVTITSTDAGAGLPADAALALGTGTFVVTLNSSGSWTITATDVTDGSKTPGVSSSVTVP